MHTSQSSMQSIWIGFDLRARNLVHACRQKPVNKPSFTYSNDSNEWNKVIAALFAVGPARKITEELEGLLELLNEEVYVLLGVVEVQTCPCRVRISQRSMERLATVVASPYSHPFHVKEGGQIGGMDFIADKRDQGSPTLLTS